MSEFKLIIKTFLFYWKKNVVLALGVAISTAVITGSLVVGDSVQSSLENQVDLRLGKATHSLTAGDRFFTSDLAERISTEKGVPAAPLLMMRGIAVADGGAQRVPGVQILGVDRGFDYFASSENYYGLLERGEVIISENLAHKLELEVGDQLLFRIQKASLIPLNAPFVSDEETSIAVRVKVTFISGEDVLGRFDLSNSQTSPMNAFFDLDYLNDIMDLQRRANLILVEDSDYEEVIEVDAYAGSLFEMEDFGLTLHYLQDQEKWELSSERVFIEEQVRRASMVDQGDPETVFTYFINSFVYGSRSSPYSFVGSSDKVQLEDSQILINSWLAKDLGVKPGDSISLEYFAVGPLRELEERVNTFIVDGIYGMDDQLADSSLMPYLPGLSDAGSCSDWEAGIPIDLDRIRDKDEEYWDLYKGSPKAFISMSTSQALWANRFGESTAIRYFGSEADGKNIESTLLNNLSTRELGFQITASKSDGLSAARGGTDFGQLFLGLSFFLLLAGIILTIVLFLLGVESRSQQLGTFSILGFSKNKIRKIIFLEGLIASFVGLVLGLVLTVFYNNLIFSALNGVWSDIVRTDALELYFKPLTLATGVFASLLIVLISMYLSLNRFLKRKLIDLHRSSSIQMPKIVIWIKQAVKWIALTSGLGIVIFQMIRNQAEDPGMFFMAGGLLLVSFLLFVEGLLSVNRSRYEDKFGVFALGLRNATGSKTRSLSIIIMFALGVFLVVTTGANHKDPYSNSDEKTSGTGGFQYIVETTVPVLHNLNNPEIRFRYGIEGSYDFVHFRRMDGDDASCLNLNKIRQPAILGVKPDKLEGRFNFVTHTEELDLSDPWKSLTLELGDGLIPAIADQTVIQWGLGLKVGDTLIYQDELGAEMQLLLIGGLGNSIFQGNVMISDQQFLRHFPSSSGSSFFLIDNVGDAVQAENELSRGFRDFGWDMNTTVQKLAEFNSIENTYLSIFLILGALGLLLGTVGLGVILVRNLLERKKELAMFKALGFGNGLIMRVVLTEYMGLLIAGLLAGGIGAIVSVLPGLLKPHSDVSFGFLLLMVGIILLNGIIWIWFLAFGSIRRPDLLTALRDE